MRKASAARFRKPGHAPAAPGPVRARAKKVSLTVGEGVLRAMKQEAKRAGRTLSAEVSDALARELRRTRLHELVAEYEAEHGLISADELARVWTNGNRMGTSTRYFGSQHPR